MTNLKNTTAAAAVLSAFEIEEIIANMSAKTMENPADGFEFDATKLLSDPCSLDAGTVHADAEDAAGHISSIMYDEIDELIEVRDEDDDEDDQDDEDDEDVIEKSFVWSVRKYRVIKGGKEVQKVVSYLAHEHSGACGNEITVGEHDCRDTTADHITARIEDEGDESEFDEYADAFERDADTIAYLNIEDLTEEHLMSGDFQIETDDGIEMLRKHIEKLMAQVAA